MTGYNRWSNSHSNYVCWDDVMTIDVTLDSLLLLPANDLVAQSEFWRICCGNFFTKAKNSQARIVVD